MKSSMKIKHITLLILTFLFALTTAAKSGDVIPEKPNPPRLVNDFAGIIPDAQAMEDTLERFARETSNQIVVVTVNDLGDYDKADFAQRLGQKWGVGNKKYNNGIIVLVKPKNSTNGQAFIATGYGMEGPLPDALCTRIARNEMVPFFKENDYSGGIWAALNKLMPIAKGEINEETYMNEDDDVGVGIFVFILIMFIIILIASVYHDKNRGGGKGGGGRRGRNGIDDIIEAATWGALLNSGSRHSHGGGFGSSGSFGGGFGGFGGGSFGGGGGGASW
jgi:uncharacterized protein